MVSLNKLKIEMGLVEPYDYTEYYHAWGSYHDLWYMFDRYYSAFNYLNVEYYDNKHQPNCNKYNNCWTNCVSNGDPWYTLIYLKTNIIKIRLNYVYFSNNELPTKWFKSSNWPKIPFDIYNFEEVIE